MASFGSIALFHLAGITPEAFHPNDVGAARLPVAHTVGADEVRQLQASYATSEEIDVVVFSEPQLSLDELRELAAWCDGRKFAKPMIAITSPQVKPDADRMGYTQRIQAAGGTVMSGMCFYQTYVREIAEANGWNRLATNSAKLVNILGGYGYQPCLGSMEQCVEAAQTGRVA